MTTNRYIFDNVTGRENHEYIFKANRVFEYFKIIFEEGIKFSGDLDFKKNKDINPGTLLRLWGIDEISRLYNLLQKSNSKEESEIYGHRMKLKSIKNLI